MATTTNGITFKVHDLVMVKPNKNDGEKHPHAGRTGHITEFFRFREPVTAMIRLNTNPKVGHFIVVSLTCLEKI